MNKSDCRTVWARGGGSSDTERPFKINSIWGDDTSIKRTTKTSSTGRERQAGAGNA